MAPCCDRRLDDPAQEVAVAPRRILRRKLHIVGEAAREPDAVDDLLEAGLAGDAQLALEVEVRGGEKGVNPAAFRRLERARGFVDVGLAGMRASAAMTGRRTLRATCRVASESAGEAIGKPASMMSTPSASSARAMLELRRHVHREARRLLAVAQRGVEHDDRAWVLAHGLSCSVRDRLEVKVIIITL